MKRFVLLIAALCASGAALAQSNYNHQRRSLFDSLRVRTCDIVFLGNSITDGCEWAELFDNRHIRNRGISGDRSDWLLERLDPIVAGHPKKVFLMIGTNDLAQGAAPAEVAANVLRLLDRFAAESPWTKVYVQSILPVNGEEFATGFGHLTQGAAIAETNRLLAELCDGRKKVFYIDVHAALTDEHGRLDKRYTNDGLHLLAAGYLVWKEVIKPYVR